MTIDWQAIAREQGRLNIRSVESLGEGWRSRAYLVNGDVVFRFPRRDDVWPELERERQFLGEAAAILPLRVLRYLLVAPQSTAAVHGYAAYSYVPGSAVIPNTMSDAERDATADAIGAFLRALHGIDGTRLDVQLPRDDERASAIGLFHQAMDAVVPQLSIPTADALRIHFMTYLDTPDNFSFASVVRHADLGTAHVLAVDHSVVGVIDFADVSFGDPDYDFSSLFLDAGEDFAVDVARRYGHANLDQLRTKLRYFAVADCVDTIVNGEAQALAGQQELAWKRLNESC